MDFDKVRFEEVGFGPEHHELPPELKAKMEETEAVLKKKWAHEKRKREVVYEIRIGEQILRVLGEEGGKRTLERLKKLNITGTYRVVERGEHDGS